MILALAALLACGSPPEVAPPAPGGPSPSAASSSPQASAAEPFWDAVPVADGGGAPPQGIPELSEPTRRPDDATTKPPPPPPPPPGNPRPFACGTGKCDARTDYCLHSGVVGGVAPPPGAEYHDPTTRSCARLPAGCSDCSCLGLQGGPAQPVGCSGDGWTGLYVENVGYAP